MNAARNPDGDVSLGRLFLFEAKCEVKRRLSGRRPPVPPPDQPYLVVPILGQSNAYGMGLPLDRKGLDRPDPRVHQWAMSGRSKGTVVAGADPLLHETPCRRVGFGVTFAKLLAGGTGRTVLLVPAARGDTSFTPKNGYTWDPANISSRVNLYLDAVEAIDTVLERFPGSRIAVFLWHQGESDVPLTPGPVYRAKLDSVIGGLRERYGAGIPFLVGGMVPEEMEHGHRDYPVINAVHADTPNRHPRTAFVEGPRDSYNGGGDRHYSAAGVRELGQRFWSAYRLVCGDDVAAPGD